MRVLDALPRLAELSLDVARHAGSLALTIVRTVAAPVLGNRTDDDRWAESWEPPPRPARDAEPTVVQRARTARAPASARAPEPAPPAPAPPEPAPPEPTEPEPAHVDRDAVVVAESADAGAADGAGAQVRVDEPWDGYSRLTAKDVTAQLATADPATLAVVRMYEATHRNRRTVLADIDRRLATTGG